MLSPRPLALVVLLAGLSSCAMDASPDEDVAGNPQTLVVCGHGPTVPGIDVSYWQGTINWSAVAADGIRFAIVRISDGSYRDTQFAANWNGARAAGLIRGAYQFFEPGQDPITQADIVIAAVGRLGPGDMPVTIDVEAPSPSISAAAYASRIHQWVDRVTAGTGRAPMIYTGRYYWDPYVASSDFTTLPLWHAQYTTASCPNINDRWSDWAFWQYTSSGSVAGISGRVDRNRFNGSYAELQAFANSNQAPRGYLDAAACEGISGWAQDQDAPDSAIDVHIYLDGPAGDPAATAFAIRADVPRDDLCTAIGSCAHGFVTPVPLAFFDSADHAVYAYGIDSAGGPNPLLAGSPQTLHCDMAPFPMPAAGAVRRHVPNSDVLAAWGFGRLDIAPVSDALLDAIPDGPDVVPAPELVQVAGDPAVYLREYDVLRHVPSPSVMDAWGFDWGAIAAIDASEQSADLPGADVLATPYLAQGSGPSVYLIDAPPPLWAEPVSADFPSVLESGASSLVTLRLRNRGSASWTPEQVALAPTPRDVPSDVCDPSWPSCTRAALVTGSVAPGEEGEFQVLLQGPMEPGLVQVCFGLTYGDHWFSDPGEMGPADDAICHTFDVVAATADGGVTGDGGVATDGGAPDEVVPTDGCACRVAREPTAPPSAGATFFALGLAGTLWTRRRRQR